MKVHATTPAYADYNDFSHNGPHYFADSLLCVQIWRDSIRLTDLTNAMKPGHTCQSVSFTAPWLSDSADVANVMHHAGGSFPALFALLLPLAAPAGSYEGHAVELGYAVGTVTQRHEESKRTYSPFAVLAPLKEMPKKWTLPHVVRALVAGQHAGLRCTGKYSDDYAFDAAYNYFKGAAPASALIADLVNSPRGWWISADGDSIGVHCHSFEGYVFTFTLAAPTVDELVHRHHAEHPDTATQKQGASVLLHTQVTAGADDLGALYMLLQRRGVAVELDTEELRTYLAIYQPVSHCQAA